MRRRSEKEDHCWSLCYPPLNELYICVDGEETSRDLIAVRKAVIYMFVLHTVVHQELNWLVGWTPTMRLQFPALCFTFSRRPSVYRDGTHRCSPSCTVGPFFADSQKNCSSRIKETGRVSVTASKATHKECTKTVVLMSDMVRQRHQLLRDCKCSINPERRSTPTTGSRINHSLRQCSANKRFPCNCSSTSRARENRKAY